MPLTTRKHEKLYQLKKVYRECGNHLGTSDESGVFNISSFAEEESIG